MICRICRSHEFWHLLWISPLDMIFSFAALLGLNPWIYDVRFRHYNWTYIATRLLPTFGSCCVVLVLAGFVYRFLFHVSCEFSPVRWCSYVLGFVKQVFELWSNGRRHGPWAYAWIWWPRYPFIYLLTSLILPLKNHSQIEHFVTFLAWKL